MCCYNIDSFDTNLFVLLSIAGSLSDVRVLEDEGRKGEGEIRREESFFQ